jgi:hypothetical protein
MEKKGMVLFPFGLGSVSKVLKNVFSGGDGSCLVPIEK